MALPKEPRQKMINMMYLVLTAMLALNVSAEILNAFKTVNNSLLNSNTVIDSSNSLVSQNMTAMLADQNQREKAAIWKPKADSAMSTTKELSEYIDQLKTRLLKAAEVDAEGKFKEDNLEAATHLFETEGEGANLLKKLTEFKSNVVASLPEPLKSTVMKELPIDLTKPATQNAGNDTWSAAYFRMTPAIAALTILSKFQNDVKRSGNIVATKCMDQVGKVVLRLNKFEPLVSQNTEYTLPGQPVKITAGLGAFSTDNLPTVSINGSPRPVDPATGSATWETTAEGGGEKSVTVVVTFTDPNTGEKKSIDKTVKYTVGQQSGASIFLEKMNVMYTGVDNPIIASSGSGRAESMSVTFSAGSISGGSGGKYIVKPTTTGLATLTITVQGKSTPFPIKVKNLPDPIPLVGTQSGGKMPTADFKAMGGVRAQLKDSEFDAPFQIMSFTIAGSGPGFPGYTQAQVQGNRYSSTNVVSMAKPGSLIYIDDIIAKGPDGKNRKLPTIAFQLQ